MQLDLLMSYIGFAIGAIGIWKPELSTRLEQKIDDGLIVCDDYQRAAIAVVAQAKENAEIVFSKVAKGPELKTIDEMKADQIASLERIKSYGFGWMGIIGYYTLLPIKIVIHTLNVLGRGRAIAGLGFLVGIIGIIASHVIA